MRLPVKLNAARWPAWCGRVIARFPDPRPLCDPVLAAGMDRAAFSAAVSAFKLGTTCKTTAPGRHARTDAAIVDMLAGTRPAPEAGTGPVIAAGTRPVILDVGASDGSTSLDLMDALGGHFSAYWVTDLHVALRWRDAGGTRYFYDREDRCQCAVDDRFLYYADYADGIWPLGDMARRVLDRAPQVGDHAPAASVVQPELVRRAATDERVRVAEHDVFTPWTGPRADCIKAANVLNRDYFPDAMIVAALGHLLAALAPGGVLCVIDNRDVEKATLFRREERDGAARLVEARRVGAGTEIADLALRA
ncbi:MAG: hypothetical protein AB7E47_07555 [Desulfovibrionaceae bacterium]